METMKLEDRPGDLLHDPGETTERRRVQPAEREVLDLLGADPGHRPWLRLSVDEWERVDRVAEALHDARAHDPLPTPRSSAEERA